MDVAVAVAWSKTHRSCAIDRDRLAITTIAVAPVLLRRAHNRGEGITRVLVLLGRVVMSAYRSSSWLFHCERTSKSLLRFAPDSFKFKFSTWSIGLDHGCIVVNGFGFGIVS